MFPWLTLESENCFGETLAHLYRDVAWVQENDV